MNKYYDKFSAKMFYNNNKNTNILYGWYFQNTWGVERYPRTILDKQVTQGKKSRVWVLDMSDINTWNESCYQYWPYKTPARLSHIKNKCSLSTQK